MQTVKEILNDANQINTAYFIEYNVKTWRDARTDAIDTN